MRGNLTINLAHIRENYRLIKEKVGSKTRVSAVVKANAYGLGAPEIVKTLIKANCQDFFVANINEALELRETYKNINLYILNGFYADNAQTYIDQNLTPVISSLLEIEGIKAFEPSLPIYLNFNTRMNRLGFSAAEQNEIWEDMTILDSLNIKGIMSHLACADEADHPMNKKQLQIFSEIAKNFPSITKALSNSSGVFLGTHFHFDMVRPGACLYGVNPTPNNPNPMHPVVSLKVPIIHTRLVYKDATVGYNATYRFEKDSPIATVSAGYADGLHRSLSNNGGFYWNGIRCPIRGRVSMDLITVDLSDIPEDQHPKRGDYLEVLGPNQSLDALATDAGTIGYEILTSLGNRYERSYTD